MPKARVTSREIDFSMGKFGLRYTSRNVAFDPEDIQGMQDRRQQFDKELNHAREMDVLRNTDNRLYPAVGRRTGRRSHHAPGNPEVRPQRLAAKLRPAIAAAIAGHCLKKKKTLQRIANPPTMNEKTDMPPLRPKVCLP